MDGSLSNNFTQLSFSALPDYSLKESINSTLNMLEIIDENLPEIDHEKMDEIVEGKIQIHFLVIMR